MQGKFGQICPAMLPDIGPVTPVQPEFEAVPMRRRSLLEDEDQLVTGPIEAAHAAGILRATLRLGRAIWRRWSGYHRRSLAETKMNCLKLLGERVRSRDFDRQVAELHIRAAILNRFTALGTPVTQPAA